MISYLSIIDILPIILAVIFLFGAKPVKSLDHFNDENYLSIESGKYYRGFFAIVVLFHHLAQNTDKGIIFHKFYLVGYMAVAFFFFLSGYGLQKSYMTKGEAYRKSFLFKRIPQIFIPFIIITVLYWIAYLYEGHFYTIGEIFSELSKGNTITLNSWYIVNILLFYLVYWVLMTVFKEKYVLMIVGAFLWNIAYVFFCMNMGFGEWWFNATHLLIVGMIWALYEKKITVAIKKTYLFTTPVIWIIFLTLFLFKYYKVINTSEFHFIVKFFIAFFFVLAMLLFFFKVQIGNKVLSFLGDISLEIYLTQGLFIMLLHGNHINIENDFLYSVCVIILTIALSYLLHLGFNSLKIGSRMLTPGTDKVIGK